MNPTTTVLPNTSQPAEPTEVRPRTEAAPTEAGHDHTEPSLTLIDAGLYVATAAYDEALRMPNPVATLDRMLATLDEILPDVLKVVAAKGLDAKSGAEFGEALRVATLAQLLGFAAIEHTRVEIGPDYAYLCDYLVENLRAGADPRAIRKAAEDTPQRLRDQAETARQADAMTDQQA